MIPNEELDLTYCSSIVQVDICGNVLSLIQITLVNQSWFFAKKL